MGYRNRKITAIAAAIVIAGLAGSAVVPAYAGKLVDGYYVHADNFGNLIIQKPGGYKQIVVGQGHVLKTFRDDSAATADETPPTGPHYRYRDENDDGNDDEHRYSVQRDNSNAYCVGGAVVVRGRSFMYGVPRGATPHIGRIC